ncbi:MAG: radical SAM protein [Deltaproteobacteria bacterium]|nr:radical SAM protein [Deltaproteobacteria bacterium]
MPCEKRVVFHSFDLEFTNICHNNCFICPREKITRGKGFLSFETLSIFASEFSRYSPLVTISGLGDPLLHPMFCDFIHYLKGYKFKVVVVVNIASLVNNYENVKKIVDSSPHSTVISISSLEPEVLRTVYNGKLNQGDVIETLKIISTTVGDKSRLRISTIITDRGEEITYYKRILGSLGIPIWFTRIHSRGGNLSESKLFKRREIRQNSGCSLFLFHTFIAQNGDVLSCCHDITGETTLTNIAGGANNILSKKENIIKHQPFFQLCNKCDEPLRDLKLPHDYHLIPMRKLMRRIKIYNRS